MSRVSQGDFTDCMRLKRCNILPCRSVSCFLIGAWRSFHTCAACVHLFICIYTHRHFSCLHFCALTVLFNFNFIDQYFYHRHLFLWVCVCRYLFFSLCFFLCSICMVCTCGLHGLKSTALIGRKLHPTKSADSKYTCVVKPNIPVLQNNVVKNSGTRSPKVPARRNLIGCSCSDADLWVELAKDWRQFAECWNVYL